MNPLKRTVLLALVSAWLVLILAPAAPAGTAVVKVICPGSASLQMGVNWKNELPAGDVEVTTSPGLSTSQDSGRFRHIRRHGQTIYCEYLHERTGWPRSYSYTIKRQIIECKSIESLRGVECTVKD